MSPVRFLVAPPGADEAPFFMHVSTTILKDLAAQLSKVFDQYERVGAFVLIDEKVRGLYPDSLALKQARSILSIEGGEGVKQLDSLERISTWLVQEKAERGALLVVIGGGSLLDLGGFVASIFKRGLRLVFVPTTLLSMVDAAIGGKNGVNMAGAKNMLGTFYQPEAIITDEKFLLSLSAAEIKSGLSEMLKHAFISGGQHWDDFCKQASRDLIPSAYLIEHSARVKAKISSQDERELSLRKVLNFGHTVGHALESYCLENGISTTHGECVAAGMEGEIRVAEAMGIT
ncbi:MAG: 3-dehydroquinate synthase family protein, partial [Flavobacteriales bacterium]